MREAMREEAIEEKLLNKITDLETVLTIYQLFLLLAIDSGSDGCGVHEPIWPLIIQKPLQPITIAPRLCEGALFQMAQARALERLGFIELDPQEPLWNLTATGRTAVRWWRENLEDWPPDTASAPSTT